MNSVRAAMLTAWSPTFEVADRQQGAGDVVEGVGQVAGVRLWSPIRLDAGAVRFEKLPDDRLAGSPTPLVEVVVSGVDLPAGVSAMFVARSATRSRSVMILNEAVTSRRSPATGCWSARSSVHSSSSLRYRSLTT